MGPAEWSCLRLRQCEAEQASKGERSETFNAPFTDIIFKYRTGLPSCMVVVGIIGGSGVDDPKILKDVAHKKAHTPYGAPSDRLTIGTFGGIKVVIVPRHGEGHRFNPTTVNYRANVWALREEGVTHLVAPTACGSLREEIKPGDMVFVDQFIDRTTRRVSTFYEGHQVCHIPMAEPFCPKLRAALAEAARAQKIRFHPKGTIVTIELPR